MGFIGIYVTHENEEAAKKIGTHLLEKRLIACANYFPIQSSYWWNEKIQNAEEIVSLFKTRKENWEKVRDEIKSMHPYETPCIIRLDLEANTEYETWVQEETV